MFDIVNIFFALLGILIAKFQLYDNEGNKNRPFTINGVSEHVSHFSGRL